MIVVVGGRRHAIPLEQVERVERMAAPTSLPAARPGVVGVLNVRGQVLPVVDPRPRLGLATPPFAMDQSLVVVTAGTRYLLWVDGVERIQLLPEIPATPPADVGASVVVRLDDEAVPLLSPEVLDPGPIIAEMSHR